MFYTVYKTTNLINGKFYIGTHKTLDPNDDYLGSGKLLKKAIEKHGVENFVKEVLHVFDNPEDMFAKEAEIVTEDFLAEENCYNLKVGGFGGFDYILANGLHRSSIYVGVPLSDAHKESISDSIQRKYNSGEFDHIREMNSQRISGSSNPMKCEKAREKISTALSGMAKSETHRHAISESLKGKSLGRKYPNRKKRAPVEFRFVTCPHCHKSGSVVGMARWHFENCKSKQG